MKAKINSLFALGLLSASLMLLNSCSKDESAPKLQFVFNGETLTLKGAHLYLTHNGNCCNDHDYRYYFISDGVYTNADGTDGWSIEDYTDATYFIGVELGVPGGEDFSKGAFPQHYSWNNLGEEDNNASNIYFENADIGENYIKYQSPEEDDSPIVIGGGFDDGETMTLKFNGTLTLYHYDGENWVYEDVTGKFFFKGEVNDERPI
jgi:hypothetical protein